MTPQVRPASSEDLSAFLALHALVHELHLRHRPDQFKPTEADAIVARFQELLTSETNQVWIAELASNVVGCAVATQVQRAQNTWCPPRRWCHVEQIVVDPQHQRQGVATALVQAIIDNANAAGICDIELDSWAFNQDAHRAFERLGFRPKTIRFELKP